MKIEFDPGEQMRLVTTLVCLERYKTGNLDVATSEEIVTLINIVEEIVRIFFETAEDYEIERVKGSLSRFQKLVKEFTNQPTPGVAP